MLPRREFSSFILFFGLQELSSPQRQEHCTKAHSIFIRLAREKDAQSSTFRKAIKTVHLMSEMNHISSLLAMKKRDFSKAFLHARLHLKLGYRAWSAIELPHKNNKTNDSSNKLTAATGGGGDGKLTGDELSLSINDTDDDGGGDGDDLANKMSTMSLAAHRTSPRTNSSPFPAQQLLQNISLPLWSTFRRLFDALVHLSHLFAHWGLFPEARYYVEQALRIVDPAPVMAHGPSCLKSQALGCLGGYFVRNGNVEDLNKGLEMLKQAEDLVRRHNLRQVDHHLVALCLCRAKYYMFRQNHKKEKVMDEDRTAVDDALSQAGKVLKQLLATDALAMKKQRQPVSMMKLTDVALAPEDLSAEMMSKLTLQHHDVPFASSSTPTRRLRTQTRAQPKARGKGRVARSKNGAGANVGKSSSALVTTSGAKAIISTATATTNSRGGSITAASSSSSSAAATTDAGADAGSISSILSRLRATILRCQASVATSMDDFELAVSLLSEAGTVLDVPHEDQIVFNKIAAGKLHLRQAVDAMAADPVFCVLPESTTSLPSVCVVSSAVAGRDGRQGGAVPASERSPIKRKKALGGSPSRSAAAVVKGRDAASRDTTTTRIVVEGEHAVSQTGLPFSQYLAQAHEDIFSIFEHAKMSCSTTDVHKMMDLLTRTIVMLSASSGSQAKVAVNTMFVLYTTGELKPEPKPNIDWPLRSC